MSKRCLGIAAVVALACLGTGPRVRLVDGIAVVGGAEILARPLVAVRNLQFYRCVERITGKPRSVIVGDIVSHLENSRYTITVIVDLFEVRPTDRRTVTCGRAKTEIKRPVPGQLTHFRILGPEWWSWQVLSEGHPCYRIEVNTTPIR